MSTRDAVIRSDVGLVPTAGTVLYDLRDFTRDPGIRYWKRIVDHAASTFRRTTPLVVWMCFFSGAAMAIQSINVLGLFGADRSIAAALVGSLGLRELTISVSLFAISATVGAGFVTELGAMRISEEVDALETMGIRSHPYLLSTRLWGAVVATVPMIVFGIGALFFGCWAVAFANGDVVTEGTFSHFFWRVVSVGDILATVTKGATLTFVTAAVALSVGYRATGGPVGVGTAVGRALNLSILAAVLVNLALSYVFWGGQETQLI